MKFFFQYLLAPLIIAIVGGLITITLQTNQRHLEEMKFTEQIIKDAYDTSNVARGLAICLLIKPVLKNNPEYADSLIKSITAFYASRVKEAARNGDVKAIEDIQNASEDIGGPASDVGKEIKGSQVINKTEMAKEFEEKGFQLLSENKIPEAKAAFTNAEASYNGFHNAYEISRLLTKVEKNIKNQPSKFTEETDSVKKIIQSKYSWHMNK
jgi:hypothetical protein